LVWFCLKMPCWATKVREETSCSNNFEFVII
jgi:hypothetical protein